MSRLTFYDDWGNPCYRMKQYSSFHAKEITTVVCDSDVARKLAEYEDLDERGLSVRSPCRTGDIVYDISVIENTVSTLKILSVAIIETNLRISWNTIGGKYDGMWGCSGLEIGKTTFFAREEAERALSLKLKGE